ncbi:sulfite exporter TauE/SafE family protein [Schinkia sp. CFF1]
MITGIIYFFVIIFADIIGALTGMGGGVIIKPILDAIGAHDLFAISFYSSVAVLVMSVVSTFRQIKNGIHIQFNCASSIIIGSIFGGIVGNITFERLLLLFSDDAKVQWIQIIVTIISLLFALLYTLNNWKSFGFTSFRWYFIVGTVLGFLASLLGIGGGPINVALLMLCFGISIKEAVVYSIATILFSQLSKVITIGFTTHGFAVFDLSMLVAIIPAAIIGALIGTKISNILKDNAVLKAYQIVVILVILLNIGNGLSLATF